MKLLWAVGLVVLLAGCEERPPKNDPPIAPMISTSTFKAEDPYTKYETIEKWRVTFGDCSLDGAHCDIEYFPSLMAAVKAIQNYKPDKNDYREIFPPEATNIEKVKYKQITHPEVEVTQ